MKLGRTVGLIAMMVVVGTASARRSGASIDLAALAISSTAKVSDPSLVGVWRVVRFCRDDPTGRLYDPYGPNPTGLFVYAPSGELSIQMMSTPPVGPFAAGDDRPTDAERRQLFDSYLGYYGRYTITSDSTVVHHVVGGTIPSYTGTDQARVYRIRGDTLTIGGNRVTWPCRVLLRVKSPVPPVLPRVSPRATPSMRDDSLRVATLEQQVETAAARRDSEFLDSIWSPTFRFTHAGGTTQTRAELLGQFRQARRTDGPRTLAREVDSLSVEMHLNTAVTTGIIRVRQCTGPTYRGYAIRFIRVYRRSESDRWQLLSHRTVGPTPSELSSNMGAPPFGDRCG